MEMAHVCVFGKLQGVVERIVKSPNMKSPQRNVNKRTQPSWWSAVLSVLVALSLALQPACICALAEISAHESHAGGHSHSAETGHGHSHEAATPDHHTDHQSSEQPEPQQEVPDVRASGGSNAAFAALDHGACCCESEAQSVVAASVSRISVPDHASVRLACAPPYEVFVPEISTMANCRGRDGPPGRPLRSQFVPASLLGRAPPISI